MILEIAILQIRPGESAEFETAFKQAVPIISSMKGFIQYELHQCMEVDDKYNYWLFPEHFAFGTCFK